MYILEIYLLIIKNMWKIHTMSDWHKFKLVTKEEWIKLFNENKEVFKIYIDDSEALIEKLEDFNEVLQFWVLWFWIEVK